MWTCELVKVALRNFEICVNQGVGVLKKSWKNQTFQLSFLSKKLHLTLCSTALKNDIVSENYGGNLWNLPTDTKSEKLVTLQQQIKWIQL